MATVTASYNWVSGETVTPTKLNSTAAPTVVVADNEVTTAKILDANVTNAKLASDIDASKLTSGTLPIARIADGAVGNAKLADGTVVQVVHATTNATTDIANNIPSDNTIPQNTEGSEILTATITPSSSTNKVLVSAVVNGTTISAVTYNVAIFKDSVANAISASRNYGEGYTYQSVVLYYDSPATTSAVTYKVRCGASSGTFYLNQNNGDVGLFGGACNSTLTLTEIKAS
jgi:hypothetical protein